MMYITITNNEHHYHQRRVLLKLMFTLSLIITTYLMDDYQTDIMPQLNCIFTIFNEINIFTMIFNNIKT